MHMSVCIPTYLPIYICIFRYIYISQVQTYQPLSEHQATKGQGGQRVLSISEGPRVAGSLQDASAHRLQVRSRALSHQALCTASARNQPRFQSAVSPVHAAATPWDTSRGASLATVTQDSLPHQLHLSTHCFSCRAIPFFFFS